MKGSEILKGESEVHCRASLEAAANIFRVLGDETRIQIASTIFNSELNVCSIAENIGMSQSAVSHQLSLMKAYRIVRSRREGKNIFYSLHDDHIRQIIEQTLNHVEHY
ncbi:MAG: metalloregulator ArsR/SmtB family transcription factor [Bacillota bacterium]|nr:metalloregulator ArsR/SmtB family transcription factor [Bacillota bacterium]